MIFSETMDNQVKDLEVKKIKDKIGDFIKGSGKDFSSNQKKSVILGNVKNKTLNEFLIWKNEMNIHDKNYIRKKDDNFNLENQKINKSNTNNEGNWSTGKENKNIEYSDDINKFFKI